MTMTLEAALSHLKTEDAFWALAPDQLHGLADRLARQAAPSASSARRNLPPTALTSAVVPIIGPLTRRASFISEILGLSTYDRIRGSLRQAAADATVERIILFVDSPGGAVTGCEETAAAVTAAARTKPVIAYCDGLMASAAYWISSQATEIVTTPSGEAGSIGVIAVHVELSGAFQQAGIKPTILLSRISPRKADLNPYEPLDPRARVRALEQIDQIAAGFVSSVARGRRRSPAYVTEHFGKGDMLSAIEAKTVGMVDRIATFETLVAGAAENARLAAALQRRLALEAAR